jgi:putative peptide zinc metalloprotease protein
MALVPMVDLNHPTEPDAVPLFSAQWHRVKDLRPRWHLGVQVQRQWQRGQLFYVVSDSANTQSLQLNKSAWEIFARCQGEHTVDQIWQQLQKLQADLAPTQDDMLEILASGFEAKLLHSRDLISFTQLAGKQQKKERDQLRGRFSPLGIKIDLGNPSRFFNQLRPLSRLLFSLPGALMWVIAISYFFINVLTHQQQLFFELGQQSSIPSYWLLMWCCFIPIKAIHEASHAMAAQKFGVATRQLGVQWMWISPAPYVDVSGAEQLVSRRARVIISAAGIAAELALAACAMWLWQATEPGLIHNIALACLSTTALSTLIFNGNPLVKMDGYYVLTDALNLANLSARSQQWWSQLGQQLMGTLRSGQKLVILRNELPWLIAYTPASWLWRATIFVAAWYWLGALNRWLGFAMGLAGVLTLIVIPASRAIAQSQRNHRHFLTRLRTHPKLAAAALTVIGSVALLPMPDRIVQPGIVWLAADEAIKAQADGFVNLPESASRLVEQPVQLSDPKLNLELDRSALRIKGIKVKIQNALSSDLAQAAVYEKELEIALAQQKRLEEKLTKLKANAASAGDAQWINAEDLPGRWVRNGEVLGYVKPRDQESPVWVQVALAQFQAARISASAQALRSAHVHLVSNTTSDPSNTRLVVAQVSASRPSALTELPSAALSSQFGGPINTDPTDSKALRPIEPTFALQLQMQRQSMPNQQWAHGAQTWVVLDFGYRPLLWQWARSVQEQVRSRFAVQWV